MGKYNDNEEKLLSKKKHISEELIIKQLNIYII